MARQFLTPVGLPTGSVLPATGEAGNLFYLTTDSKVYQHNGTAWVAVSGLPAGGAAGEFLAKLDNTDYSVTWTSSAPTAGSTSVVKHEVKLGEAIAKGQAVYVSSADGTNMIVSKASNAFEATSSKTMGLLEAGGSTNTKVNVVTEGLLSGLNTGAANAGDPVWLGTAGNLIYGLASKPAAPAHLVFIGVVTRANSSNGEIFVKVQNGFELRELHTVSLEADASIADNEVLAYDTTSGLWENQTNIEANLAQLSGGNSLTGQQLIVSSSTSATGLIVRAISSQTADLQQWQSSASTVVASVSPTGVLTSGSGTYDNYNADSTIRAEFRGTAGTHRPYIELQGVGANDVTNENGGAFIRFRTSRSVGYGADIGAVRRPTGASQLIFKTGTATADSITQKMSIDDGGNVLINGFSSGIVGLTVRGAVSQSANLQEWQDSAGTILSRVTSGGSIVSTQGFAVLGGAGISGSIVSLFQTTSASRIPVVVQGASSQSADLTQWQNGAGSNLLWITSAGNLNAPGQIRVGTSSGLAQLSVVSTNAATIAQVVRGAASQTANLTEWQDSTGTTYMSATAFGGLSSNLTGAYPGRWSVGTGTATTIGLVVRGVASQTANMQEWQDSAGSVRAAIDSVGRFNSVSSANLGGFTPGTAVLGVQTSSSTTLVSAIRGASGQTADLTQWQDSAGTVLAEVTSVGDIYLPNSAMFIGTTYLDAKLSIDTQLTTQRGIVVRGAASQTANLQEWRNSSNTVLASVNSSGDIQTSAAILTGTSTWLSASLNVRPLNAGVIGEVIRGATSQTANLTEWQNSSGTVLSRVTSSGLGSFDVLNAPNGAYFGNIVAQPGNGAYLAVQGYAPGQRPLLVRGFGATTANLFDLQNGSGTVVGGFNGVGQVFTGSIGPLVTATGGATTAASGDGTTATITTTSNHGLAVGDIVTVAGVTPTGYNGSFSVSAVTSNTFSYANATTGSQTVAGTVVVAAQSSSLARSAGTTGLVVRGAASQVADLVLVQDSAQAAIFRVRPNPGNWTSDAVNVTGPVQITPSAGGTGYGLFVRPGSTVVPAVLVRALANHVAELQTWQDGSSTTVASMRATGQLALGADTVRGSQTVAINTHTPSGTTNISITTASAHGVSVGQRVTISGVTPSGYNGSYTAESGTTGSTLVVFIGSNPGAITTGGTLTQSPRLGVTALSAQNVPLVVRGASSQSANLMQLQDSSGTVRSRFTSTGMLEIQPESGDTINFRNSGGTLTLWGGATSYFTTVPIYMTGGSWTGGRLSIDTTGAGNVGATIRGSASQTADLTQWQDNAGTVLSKITSAGSFYVNTNNNTTGVEFLGDAGTQRITANGNDLSLIPRFDVLFSPATSSGRLRPANDNTSDLGTSGQRWKILFSSGLSVVNSAAASVVATIKGAASQSADLQQWQNSAGTVLSEVDSAGNIFTNNFFGTNGGTPNVFGVLYASGTPSAYAEGSLSTNAGFSTPVMLPNEEGYYPYWGFKTPNVVETSADGTTWTVVDPTAYRSLFAFQNGSSINVTTRFLRITHYQPTFTFLALVSARFVGGTNNKPVTMKTELLNSDYSTVNSTYGPTAGVVGFDGAALMQKFNSYNGSTNATRVTFDMALWASGDSYQIGSVMAYMSKPGTGFGFQNKFPMLWDVNRTATFRPSQPGAMGLIVQAAVTATSTITAATANGTTITYTTSAQHGFLAGFAVSITGIASTGNPGATAGSGFNLTGATIAAVLNQTQFTVTNALVDTYTSGGTLSVAQGADLQQWRNAAGTAVARVSSVGDLVISGIGITSGDHRVGTQTYFSAALNVQARAATEKGQVIRAAASQTASMLELQNSAGTITANFTAPVNNVNRLNLGNTDLSATLGITIHASGGVGQVIRAAASQSADIQQWQNSAGGVIAKVDSVGDITARVLRSQLAARIATNDVNVAPMVISTISGQVSNSTEWQDNVGVVARVAANGVIYGAEVRTMDTQAVLRQVGGGGNLYMLRATSAPAAPGANVGSLFFRDGTTAGTLRLAVRSGASGAEETLVDNINTNGTASSRLAVRFIDGGSA